MTRKLAAKKSTTSVSKKKNNKTSTVKTKKTIAQVEYPKVDRGEVRELVETVREYSIGHEIANAVTHGIGGGLSIAGLSVLVTMAAIYGDTWRVVSSAIYGATLVMLYLASTLYHGIHHEGAKRIFKTIDHAAIYLLIAGTYTPFTLVSLRENANAGWTGWTLFGTIWGLALTGVTLKAAFPRRMSTLSVAVYILMGWLCMFAIGDIRKAIGFGGMVWLVAGGLSYTIGVIFYAWAKLPFNHAIWHLFVLSGSICHFFAILFYVLPFAK
ncbi:MAG: hemolysin III family protein [Leptospiraceae bacterium]|nr:hemolysin III family protein [Leptospiraceae bacterium]